MAFTENSQIAKAKHAVFLKYNHGVGTDISAADAKKLGQAFLDKRNRDYIIYTNVTGDVEIGENNTHLLHIIDVQAGSLKIDIISAAIADAGNRVFYIVPKNNDITLYLGGVSSQTLLEDTFYCVFFFSNTITDVIILDDTEVYFPMGIVLADDMSLKTSIGEEAKSIEGQEYVLSENIEVNFSLARLFNDKIEATGFEGVNALADFSNENNVEMFLYSDKPNVVLLRNMVKSKQLEVVGNDLGKTIYSLKKEVPPGSTDITFA